MRNMTAPLKTQMSPTTTPGEPIVSLSKKLKHWRKMKRYFLKHRPSYSNLLQRMTFQNGRKEALVMSSS
jgi:hypothetical protein